MSDRHVLIVDDDDRIRSLLKEYLAGQGYRVTGAADAAAAGRLLERFSFDLLILDVMMPGENGVDFARRLRARGSPPPILMLSARGMADDRIAGLAAGVDDYLSKPFEPQELVLRIEAILRRAAAAPPRPEGLRLGAFTFDPARGELLCDGAPVRLTEGEATLLRRLAQSPHVPVDRLDLPGGGEDGIGRAVDIQVTRLRRKLEDDPKNPRYLQTVRGRGYMLAPD